MESPLTDLTKKTANTSNLKWTAEYTEAFQQLKDALCANPVLKSPCFDRTFILQTDASNRGIEAVLSQCDKVGVSIQLHTLVENSYLENSNILQ